MPPLQVLPSMECVLSSLACPPICSSHGFHFERRPLVASPAGFASQRLLLVGAGAPTSTTALCSFWIVTSLGRPKRAVVVCSGGADDARTSPKISSDAKMRSEVISPFRSVRMFFYLAFIASGSIGALTSLPRLIAALGHAPNASPITEVLSGLGIDLIAVLVFAFLYSIDVKARDQQLAKLSREESLAGLKLELKNKKVISVGQMRGVARLVIVAGPAAHIEEAFRSSEAFSSSLMERGVLIVPFATDGQVPKIEFASDRAFNSKESEAGGSSNVITEAQVQNLWRATPIYTSEWARWLKEQKQLANVSEDSPVYLSLRMDGRVRGSGIGSPPWGAFVAQLPPLKGIWSGALDGMDGRI